ncbi:MAG: Rpn family recombination-promoting nuclease/putative transposase [Sphaerospermopsis sp. SIO1G2]|nr:Rpn family recombination-promoting nuclease/putative transposase [Sphaerospermopsis sp. SIO1G2]
MSSVFIDLKLDYAFKIVFGQEGREPSLINFLNAVLYNGRSVIKKVKILNPYMPGDVASLKDTFVDILAEVDSGDMIIIEMQMSMNPAFFKRMIYNVAKKYSGQLDTGEYYDKLSAVIGLVVANFTYPQAEQIARPITQYALLETTDHILYPDSQDFQIAIVELPKFQKALEQVDDHSDMWLFMLNHADGLVEVPAKMAQVKAIQMAFEAARRVNLQASELDELEKRRMYALEAEASLALTREDALEEGIGIGREQGIGIGREQGIGIGREQGIRIGREEGQVRTRQMILQMLELGLPLEQIAQIAEMRIADVQQIEQELYNGRSES